MAKIPTSEESLIQTLNVSAAGGVLLATNTIEQRSKPGFADRLVNFEPASTGGYRRISGYGNWGTGVLGPHVFLISIIQTEYCLNKMYSLPD